MKTLMALVILLLTQSALADCEHNGERYKQHTPQLIEIPEKYRKSVYYTHIPVTCSYFSEGVYKWKVDHNSPFYADAVKGKFSKYAKSK